jgi:hypothetical protein
MSMQRTRKVSDEFRLGERELLQRLGVAVAPADKVESVTFRLDATPGLQPQWIIEVCYTSTSSGMPDVFLPDATQVMPRLGGGS